MMRRRKWRAGDNEYIVLYKLIMKNQPKATRSSVAIPLPVLTVQYPDIWIYAKHDTKELEEYLISIQPTFATILPKTNIHDGLAFLSSQFNIPMHP